jgi:hypothetical protein
MGAPARLRRRAIDSLSRHRAPRRAYAGVAAPGAYTIACAIL